MLHRPKGQRRFSDHFGISKGQSQLDFVDIPMDTDIELYVDPYALHVSSVDWLRNCGDLVANYFDVLLEALRAKDHPRAMNLISNLHEPNETRLGQSKGKPQGRGWGQVQARQLYDRLSKSRAVSSGRLQDLGDFELLVPGIGSDKISDLAINVIRGELTAYTKEQCDLYGIPTELVAAGSIWNPEEKRWEGHYAQLPVYEDEGMLLVPKVAVRRYLVPDAKEFYDHYVLRFLEAEHLHARDSLVYTLKNGNSKVYVSDLRAKYPSSKEFLFDFSEKNPAILKDYKDTLPEKAAESIADESIEGRQLSWRRIDHAVSAPELRAIPSGPADASKYHNFMIGALTEIFHPQLTRPVKEQQADEGRKRIDIFFHNSASKGFFSRLVNSHKYHAPYISIECKNYSSDPHNPEFDQLLGRLNRKRGFVGILACRTIADKGLVLKRCRDVVNNDRERLILVLDDNDICTMLDFLAANERKKIDEYLEDKLKEVLV
jgi:hypothetical protein